MPTENTWPPPQLWRSHFQAVSVCSLPCCGLSQWVLACSPETLAGEEVAQTAQPTACQFGFTIQESSNPLGKLSEGPVHMKQEVAEIHSATDHPSRRTSSGKRGQAGSDTHIRLHNPPRHSEFRGHLSLRNQPWSDLQKKASSFLIV